jgi:hypothetical protein
MMIWIYIAAGWFTVSAVAGVALGRIIRSGSEHDQAQRQQGAATLQGR